MAKTVASLSVSINARTKGLRKGLRAADRLVSDFAGRVSSVVGGIAKIGAGLAAVGAGVAAVGVKRAFSDLDSLAKTADKLDIKPAALLALRDAAEESGVPVKTLEMALQRMSRRVQEAANGSGEAKDTIKELGLNARSLVELPLEKQFLQVAKAMQRAAHDGQSLRRAFKLFDSEGVALINTLRLVNKRGLQPFITEVQRSGRAVTRDQLRPIEAVNDAFNRLGKRIGGVFDQIAVALSPALSETLADLERFLNRPENVAAMQDAFRELAGWINDSLDKLIEFAKNWRETKDTIAGVVSGVAATGRGIVGAGQALGTAVSGGGIQEAIDIFDRAVGNAPGRIRGGFAPKRDKFGGDKAPDEELKKQTPILEQIRDGLSANPAGLIPQGSMIVVQVRG